jgi:hypothetical protein
MKLPAFITAAMVLFNALPAQAAGECKAESGPRRAALVELYTSEGCSSCPPADRALSSLTDAAGKSKDIIPLALHVTYWDAIGWKDGFAQKMFDTRQSYLLEKSTDKISYTPQFFINGKEIRHWQNAIPDAVAQTNAIPPGAHITLRQRSIDPSTIQVDVNAATTKPSVKSVLFLALTENKLVSHVLRGENSGATLNHDHTARTFIGPIAMMDGKTQISQKFSVPSGWNRQQLHTVAFVQDAQDGTILQAASTAQCN